MIERIMNNPMLQQLLLDFVSWLFLVYGIVGVAVGIGLAVSQERMRRLFGALNRWVSVRRSTRWLAIPRGSQALGPRHRRWLGVVFVLFPAFSLFVLVAKIDADKLASALRLAIPLPIAALLLDAARWLLIAGSLLAIAVGATMIFFPQAMQAIEARTDRWYSTRNLGRGGESLHAGLDEWVGGHPRAIGLIIALGALFVAIHFGMLLRG